MSTRSLIGIVTDTGKVRSICCHWDGYPSNNGKILLYHYNSEELASKLISLGYISSLGEKLAPEREYAEPAHSREDEIGTLVKHSFDNPQKGVTVAYHRDRGEKYEVDEFQSENGFYRAKWWAEYRYLFKNGKWYVDRCELTEKMVARDS